MSSSDPLTAPRPNRTHYGKRALASAQRSASASAKATHARSSLPTASSLSSPTSSPGSSPTRAPVGGPSRAPIGARNVAMSAASPTRQSDRGRGTLAGGGSADEGKRKPLASALGLSSASTAASATGSPAASASQTSPAKRSLTSTSGPTSAAGAPSSVSPDQAGAPVPVATDLGGPDDDGARSPPRRKRRKPTAAQIDAVLQNQLAEEKQNSSPRAAMKNSKPPSTPPRKSTNGAPRTLASVPRSPAKDLSAIFEAFSPEKRTKASIGRPLERTASGKVVASMGGRSTPRPASPTRESTPTSWITGAHPQPVQGSPDLPSPGFVVSQAVPISTSPHRPLGRSNPSPTALTHHSPAKAENIFQVSQTEAVPRSSAARALGRSSSSAAGPSGTTAKRTYGGPRKIKADEMEQAIYESPLAGASLSSPGPEGEQQVKGKKRALPRLAGMVKDRESYSSLRKKFGADEEEEYEESQALTDLRSVNQQRARGENTRFEDQFSYLVEGLGAKEPLNLRRSSAVDLLKKMLDTDFTRRLKSSGLIERVYTHFRQAQAGGGDRVLDPALAYLVATASRDQRVAEAFLLMSPAQFDKNVEEDPFERQSDLLAVLVTMLGRPWAGEAVSPALQGLTKPETLAMRGLRETIDKSNLIEPGSFEVTLRSLCIVAVSVISSFEPRPNFRPQEQLAKAGVLDAICEAFVTETKPLEQRISLHTSGLELLPPDGTVSMGLIDSCLRLMQVTEESCEEASVALDRHREAIVPELINSLLVAFLLTNNQADPKVAQTAVECLLSALGRLVELTLDHDWCETFAKDSKLVSTLVRIVKATRTPDARKYRGRFDSPRSGADDEDEDEQGKRNVDVLCGALAVLVNLAEAAPDTKHTIRKTFIDRNCKEQPRCARECQCPNRRSAIHILLDLRADELEDIHNPSTATNDSDVEDQEEKEDGGDKIKLTSVLVSGYAAAVLGLVIVDAPENRDIVVGSLGERSQALKSIAEALEGLAQIRDAHEKGVRELMERKGRASEIGPEEGEQVARLRKTAAELRE